MNANAIERLRDTMAGQTGGGMTCMDADDARAILAHITALTAERDEAVAELLGIANSTGCGDACPCWAKLRRKAERAILAGAD
jgi:hypothetical protein